MITIVTNPVLEAVSLACLDEMTLGPLVLVHRRAVLNRVIMASAEGDRWCFVVRKAPRVLVQHQIDLSLWTFGPLAFLFEGALVCLAFLFKGTLVCLAFSLECLALLFEGTLECLAFSLVCLAFLFEGTLECLVQ